MNIIINKDDFEFNKYFTKRYFNLDLLIEYIQYRNTNIFDLELYCILRLISDQKWIENIIEIY